MLKISDYDVMGFRLAIKGMRNAFKSWSKSDSYTAVDCGKCGKVEIEGACRKEDRNCTGFECYVIGEKDMSLARRLIIAGSSDRKFLRMLHVQAEVTAPLYWWKEYDTYKVGTTANSESTMHTIHKEEFTLDNFSVDKVTEGNLKGFETVLNCLNTSRENYLKTRDKIWWWQMIQQLPSSYNQMRTIDLDYETLMNIYFQRRHHKLDEWRTFCGWIENLPYMREFTEAFNVVKED